MKKWMWLVVVYVLTGLNAAFAQTDDGQVKVLGFSVGTASYDELKQALPNTKESGMNRYSGGPMLALKDDMGIEGLKGTDFIFGTDNTLQGAVMLMNKNRFDAVFDYMRAKYTLESSQRPFVGNKYARFRQGDVTVELNAPHLSFDMTVVYATKSLTASFDQATTKEAKQKQQREKAAF